MNPRGLTHDEKRAAEAAFRGLPPDPRWSTAARSVYDGLLMALPTATGPHLGEISFQTDGNEDCEESPGTASPAAERGADVAEGLSEAPVPSTTRRSTAFSRDAAIRAGVLIDVTPQGYNLGLPLPVGLTRALWDYGILTSETATEPEQEERVRDLLIALRLHLSRSSLIPPVSQFPALLLLPSNPTPQVCPVYAVVQTDGPRRHSLMLLLPNELSD